MDYYEVTTAKNWHLCDISINISGNMEIFTFCLFKLSYTNSIPKCEEKATHNYPKGFLFLTKPMKFHTIPIRR